MDTSQYSTLAAALAAVPDPRHARGKRHAWSGILTLLCAALGSGQRTGRAIGQWVNEHADDLRTQLALGPRSVPSTSTLRRAVQLVDVTMLKAHLAQWSATLPVPPSPVRWHGHAIDGKAVRGAQAYGDKIHLVSLVHHHTGIVRQQVRVRAKSNEITAVPVLLAGRALTNSVITVDAHLTQRTIAEQIVAQGGHYLMVVKDNQPQLHADIALLFAPPYRPTPADAYARYTGCEKGHGRLETRTLERSAALNEYVQWPSVGQVLRRTCERRMLNTGKISVEVTYGITSLSVQDASAAQVEALWRGHWSIENKVHYVRDVTLGEDAGQIHRGSAPHALAALRNGVLSLFRSQGVTNIADGVRHYGAAPRRICALIGLPAGL